MIKKKTGPRFLIGTLFDEEQIDQKQNINNIKQKDPMGNTRWQGAFTGGFSAGFKNTCGSKEGWQPAQFVSSVSKRADKKEQNVTDFMDKEDLGRQSISTNIQVNKGFSSALVNKNPFNIVVETSIGQKILNKFKKTTAFQSAPQNQEQLDQLLKYYEKQQVLQQSANQPSMNIFKDLEKPFSIGANQFNVQDDQFIQNYEQLYRRVIRATIKQQSEEDKQKRIAQNKIHFDFTKPIEQQPQYLKQIHQIEDLEKPRKRKKNLLNMLKLKDIFTQAIQFKQFSKESTIQKAPQDYDPYHRIRNIKDFLYTEKKPVIEQTDIKQHHRIHSISQRVDILGSQKLSNKFRSATNTFMRGDQKKVQTLRKYFEQQKKNKRYIDFVDQLQGRKIACQNQYLSYEEAQKQKQEFDRMYSKNKQQKKRNLQIQNQQQKSSGNTYTKLPKEIQKLLTDKKQEQGKITITRTIKSWKPQRLLCNRFGCLVPYKIEENKNKFQKQEYF